MYSQTPSGSCGAGQCQSITAFSSCSEGYYKAMLTSTTWDVTKIRLTVGGTDV